MDLFIPVSKAGRHFESTLRASSLSFYQSLLTISLLSQGLLRRAICHGNPAPEGAAFDQELVFSMGQARAAP